MLISGVSINTSFIQIADKYNNNKKITSYIFGQCLNFLNLLFLFMYKESVFWLIHEIVFKGAKGTDYREQDRRFGDFQRKPCVHLNTVLVYVKDLISKEKPSFNSIVLVI